MARRQQSRGICAFCGKESAKGGMTRHLRSCAARAEAIAVADGGPGRTEPIYHLQVLDAWAGYYWLHMEMRGTALLEDLDEYLRAIWLECCGHLSSFNLGGVSYTQIFDDGMNWGVQKAMDVPVGTLFDPGMETPYQYDFGTTSELVIKVLDVRQGKSLTPNPIMLMARNKLDPSVCVVCGAPATSICQTCLWENEGADCTYCDEHAEDHDCDEPFVQGIYNSPRTGMCGYDGPAEPPY